MKHLCQVFVLGWLSLTSAALGDAFFELDGLSGFYGSPGVPPDAFANLAKAQKSPNAELKCVAFTPGGDWVVLAGRNAFWTSNVNLPAAKKLAEMQKDPAADLKCVAFTPGGGWTILSGKNGFWTEGNIPEGAFKKMQEVRGKGGTLRSIAYAPNGGWVLLFDKTGVAHGDIPPDLANVLKDAINRRLSVICVAFTTFGDWICLTDNGWWTSNGNLDASKFIGTNRQHGHVPKWVWCCIQSRTKACDQSRTGAGAGEWRRRMGREVFVGGASRTERSPFGWRQRTSLVPGGLSMRRR